MRLEHAIQDIKGARIPASEGVEGRNSAWICVEELEDDFSRFAASPGHGAKTACHLEVAQLVERLDSEEVVERRRLIVDRVRKPWRGRDQHRPAVLLQDASQNPVLFGG